MMYWTRIFWSCEDFLPYFPARSKISLNFSESLQVTGFRLVLVINTKVSIQVFKCLLSTMCYNCCEAVIYNPEYKC